MNSFLPSVRRLVVLVAALAAGTLGAISLASPTSAHRPFVEGVAVCDTAAGDWVVTWTVRNSEHDLVGRITDVDWTPENTTVTGIAVDAVLPLSGTGPLTGTQRVPAAADSATLTVGVHWNRNDGVDDSRSGRATFQGTCQKQQRTFPLVQFTSSCEGNVTVTLINGVGSTEPALFTVTGQGGFEVKNPVGPEDQVEVVVPKANAGAINVTESVSGATFDGRFVPVANCLPVTGVKTGMFAAGGVALAGVGGVLFLLFRRRRVRFVS